MARATLAGTRIRDYRIGRGLRQAELAKRCGISPSYLNLIEHNRRRIGGALLVRIARALGAEPAILADGAETALTLALNAAAEAQPAAGAELDRAEELAGRFPGWARLIEAQFREARRLERIVERLDDRLTHDPFLSASMHNVLSSVTAIRSASAILANGEEIEPEWQARFHRNIYEDSQRLTDATEALVSYLDQDQESSLSATLPQEEVEQWLAGRGWTVAELEADPEADRAALVAGAGPALTAPARGLAARFLARYAADARALPRERLVAALAEAGDTAALAARLGVPLPLLFRRLTALGPDEVPGGQGFGLVACDASGTLTFRKTVPGFDVPRYGAACPLWPLFTALQRPMTPVRQALRMAARDEAGFETVAFSEIAYPAGFDGPAVVEAWMLVRPLLSVPAGAAPVGTSCRVCAERGCPARREPSVFAETASEAF